MILDVPETASLQDNSPQITTIYSNILLPSLLTRVKAVVVDGLILLLCYAITSVLIDNIGEVPDTTRIAFMVLIVLYDPLLTAFAGATVGHRIVGIKVRKFSAPHSKISLPMAFVRFMVKWFLGWIALLTVTANDHKRAIHDYAGGSIVIPADAFV